MTSSSPVSDASGRRPDERGERLAQLLRTTRLVRLVGAAGSGKTALLKTGVLPCLHRRARDRDVTGVRREGGVIYLPDRRKDPSTRDITIYFDSWEAAPLRALSMVIDAALFERFGTPPDTHVPATPFGWLAEKLVAASRASRVRFVFVLDAFDDYLEAPADDPQVVLFDEELIEVLNTPGLAAHVLIALREESEPAFDRIEARLLDTGTFVRLASLGETSRGEPSASAEVADDPWPLAPIDAPTRPMFEPPVEGWDRETPFEEPSASAEVASVADDPWPLAPIDAPTIPMSGPPDEPWDAVAAPAAPTTIDPSVDDLALERGTDAFVDVIPEADAARLTGPPPAARDEDVTWQRAEPIAPARPTTSDDPADAASTMTTAGVALASPRARPPRRPAWRVALLASIVAGCVAAAWFGYSRSTATVDGPASTSSADTARDALPSPAPRATPPLGAGFELLVDPDSATDRRIADALRNRVARGAGLDLEVRPATRWTDAFESGSDAPRLAIVRYDALEAARSASRNGGKEVPRERSIEVVMPLYTEAVVVVVRRDAPIAALHEIEGLRINTGPAQGARAMTTERLYRDLFGSPLPSARATRDTRQDALAKLVAGDGVDALVVTDGDLDALFADHAAWKAGVKLLRFDGENPASRRALRTFLPTTLGRDAGAGLTDAAIPALSEVTFLIASGSKTTAAAERDARLGALAKSLCEQLPALRRDGDRKWQEVRIGTRLAVGWPYAAATEPAFRACGSPTGRTPSKSP